MTTDLSDDYLFSGYDEPTRLAISSFHVTPQPGLIVPILSGICFYFLPKEKRDLPRDSPLEVLLGAVTECGSLTLVEFLLAVEEALKIEFNNAEMREIKGPAEFLALVKSKIAAPPATLDG
ncbi:MAG TPA: hypothetical protein VNQ90_07110 [Chthoniobacteraceae bacterium]|nr:hypothetical protein [Chthoniobacteraceae bacterium]